MAKAAQLYGLEDVSRPAKRIVERTENFKKEHPALGRIAEVVSWAAIGFGLAQAGAWLSDRLKGIGETLSDIIGYTVACAHPSAIAISLRKLFKVKRCSAGISRYLEASVVGYTPAAPVFFATLGAVVHGGSDPTISVGRAVAAAIAASIATFCTWSAAYTAWWVRVVRRQEGEGFLRNLGEFFKGFAHARKFGKGHADDSARVNAYREAGEIIGTSAVVWAAPWYTVRACVALIGGLSGLPPAAFTKFLISTMSALEGLDVLLAGVETALVERILRRNRKAEQAGPEPEKPKPEHVSEKPESGGFGPVEDEKEAA
ncbi:MAG: hypothetical protein AB1529_01790 [Candidatus Micrarchaeota archaeon]